MNARRVILTGFLMAGLVGMAHGTAQAFPEAASATVSAVSGQAEWLKGGSENWAPVQANQKLSDGDRLRLGSDGSVELALSEGSVQLFPGSEFFIQSLTKDAQAKRFQYLFGITKGKVSAKVASVPVGSKVQFQTPVSTVTVPETPADPSLSITINPDGSVSVTGEDGVVHVLRDTDPKFTLTMEGGEATLVQLDPGTGAVRVTSVNGTLDVVGPDGKGITLNTGDSVVFQGGAATFIAATPPVDAPVADSFLEPASAS